MRGARLLGMSVVGVLGGAALVVTGPAPGAAAAPDPVTTVTVSAPVQVVMKIRTTPIPEGNSNYCAVGAFVPFNEVPGYAPTSVTVSYFDKPSTSPTGAAPYADGAAINGLTFPPSGAAHQTQLGDFSYAQGGGDPAAFSAAYCEPMRQRVDSFFADTATVTYEATGTCAAAIAKLAKATTAVAKAKKKVKKTTGRAHAQAVAALKQAKAEARAAKKKYQKACG
jgi:hypothetical protein